MQIGSDCLGAGVAETQLLGIPRVGCRFIVDLQLLSPK